MRTGIGGFAPAELNLCHYHCSCRLHFGMRTAITFEYFIMRRMFRLRSQSLILRGRKKGATGARRTPGIHPIEPGKLAESSDIWFHSYTSQTLVGVP